MTDTTSRDHRVIGMRARGLIALAAVAGIVVLCVLQYNQAFADRITVRLTTDRAGLLLEPGADVAFHAVSVGEVTDVRQSGTGAVVELGIERDDLDALGSGITARIVSPTLLGPKFVDLARGATSTGPLRDGATLAAADVQVEANAAFENLITVLDTVEPAQLNAGLGGLSSTFADRGDRLGSYLEQANAYFDEFNDSLPAMERDLAAAADVTQVYANIAPDLLATLDQTATTSRTVVDRAKALDALLVSVQATSDETRAFLAKNRVPLREAMTLLRPTTATAERYAPVLPCVLAGLNRYRTMVEPASGGIYPGLWVHLSVIPGADGYRAPTDLPVVRADDPNCPLDPGTVYRPTGYDDGSPPLDNTDSPITLRDDPLSLLLFGKKLGADLLLPEETR